MKKNGLLFFSLFILVSCQKSALEKSLINTSKKWVFINSSINPKEAKVYFYMKFEENGKCKNYFLSNNEEMVLLDGEAKIDSWDYSERDSILKIYDYNFKVLKSGNDTIHLLETKNNWNAMFVNANAK